MSTITSQAVDPALLNSMNGNKTNKSSGQDAQDRFMTLLVAQMKNQDPLSPLDNAQVTSQLAQLSTVTGIEKLNDTMKGISLGFQSSQNLQAASMIGHGVVVPGKMIELKNGKSILGYELPEPADKVQVTIKNAGGAIVKTLNMPSATSGFNTLSWDGKTDAGADAPNGIYSFEIQASSADRKLSVTPLTFGMVASVSFGAQGSTLSILNMGEVALSDVRQIF